MIEPMPGDCGGVAHSGALRRAALAACAIALAWAATGTASERLTHRVWLLRGVPGEATLAALSAGGVDGLVLPVGDVTVEVDGCRLTLASLPDLKPLAGWGVAPLVWVSGDGDASGGAETFLNEMAPVVRLLGGRGGFVLAARSPWPGLVGFAGAVAKRAGRPVEIALPARSVGSVATDRLAGGVALTVMALGNAPALGFPAASPGDDLEALERIDANGMRYRVAVVVAPLATPTPGPRGASLVELALPTASEYRPAARGDDFLLRRPLDWGGTRLPAQSVVHVEAVDTARYHRDLGHVLRPSRPGLTGWDTVGLPDPEPAIGLSLEAFLDYLKGGLPFPAPQVQTEWATPTRLRLALANPSPHGSALATTGNFVELRFEGTQLLEVGLGDFAGAEYGRVESGAWRRAVAREANAIRLYLTYVPPSSRFAGVAITFFSRPTAATARWVVRLSDGRELTGGAAEVGLRKP